MDNHCPKCKAELSENQECTKCAALPQSVAPPAGVTALPPASSDGKKEEATDAASVERNLTSPTPDNPEAKKEPATKKSGDEKPQVNSPQAAKQDRPHAARQDPGLPFLAKEVSDLEPIALRIKQRGARENVVAGTYKRKKKVKKTSIEEANFFFQGQENRTIEQKISLMELAGKLPRREPQIPDGSSYCVDQYVAKLKQQHLLFISCADSDVALGAAYSVLDAMEINADQRLLVNFASNPQKSNSTIQFFTGLSNKDRQKLTAIVIDGFHPEARTFLDWLRANTTIGAGQARQHLADNNFFLLCLVNPKYLQNYVNADSPVNPFATWAVPCLQPLLKLHFPDKAEWLEREIRAQQKFGKWKESDAELCNEVRSLLDDGLVQVIEQRRAADMTEVPSVAPEIIFKGEHSIEDTLLYVGTYFPDLAPHEFDHLVESLLADRTTAVSVKTQHHNPDGTIQTIETEIEKPLRDFWSNNPDRYMTNCQLEAMPEKNGTVSIRFASESYRQTLKTQLERRHPVYLMRQFRLLQSNGFLTSTGKISDRAMDLSIEMALAYPSSFGKEWLLNIIVETRKHWEAAVESEHSRDISDRHKALERIALFCRLMLEHPPLGEIVEAVLKDLMSRGMHDTVLFLVRGLQFAPGFDEFYWMKRLVDEGDDELIKPATYYHLYSYTKKIGIYPLLAKLEAWIPTDNRPLDSYPPSCVYSLRLLVEYCAEVTEAFENDPQTQPSHPLFTFVDEAAAKENCRRLVGWFFHPAMCSVFAPLSGVFTDEKPEARVLRFICELVLEWIFVLRQQQESAQSGNADTAGSSLTNDDRFLDAGKIQNILIDSLAVIATANQHDYMLRYWERLRDFTGWIVSDEASDWIEPLEYSEKSAIRATRLVVRELIKEFRTAIRNARLRPAAA